MHLVPSDELLVTSLRFPQIPSPTPRFNVLATHPMSLAQSVSKSPGAPVQTTP